jgi:ABC-type uncharacterized transport system substrate-binding protein
MDRRRFLLSSLAGGLVAPRVTEAQQTGKAVRIGFLTTNPASNSPRVVEAFHRGLRELGYVEGRNVVIEYRSAEGRPERLPDLAAELVKLKVDVLVTMSTPAAQAGKKATTILPIVFIGVSEPVRSGLVTSLARPAGNLTGLSFLFPELANKCLELLKQAVPGVSRIGILTQITASSERAIYLREANEAARVLGLRLQFFEVGAPADIDLAFSEMTRARVDGLVVWGGAVVLGERRRVVDLAAKNRMPTVFTFQEYVDAGGLMSYGPGLADMSHRAATYVDKIVKGARPGDLPVEQPTKFDLVVNLKTAKALGVTIPPSLLARADQVIE